MTSASTPVAVLQAKSALRFEENLVYSEDKIKSNIEIKVGQYVLLYFVLKVSQGIKL